MANADWRLPIFEPELSAGNRTFCNDQDGDLRFEI